MFINSTKVADFFNSSQLLAPVAKVIEIGCYPERFLWGNNAPAPIYNSVLCCVVYPPVPDTFLNLFTHPSPVMLHVIFHCVSFLQAPNVIKTVTGKESTILLFLRFPSRSCLLYYGFGPELKNFFVSISKCNYQARLSAFVKHGVCVRLPRCLTAVTVGHIL
jgi:hypothetical protein